MKNIGIIGCGSISAIYFENLHNLFPNLNPVSCCDLDPQRTAAVKEMYPDILVQSTEELLGNSEIDVVLNLTTPPHHSSVNTAILEAGKHAYVEKPFALNGEDADAVLNLATEKGLYVGCAPDTVLGAGIQTCRKLIDDGLIGRPTAAFAFMTCHGHENWHPRPEFYYQVGGGPMLDMGPYYLSALVTLLGPVGEVAAMLGRESEVRTISEANRKGEKIPVEVDTHYSTMLKMESGAIVTLVTSFDVWASNTPRIEIHGTHGSLSCPDPNTFGGSVKYRKASSDDWEEIPIDGFGYPVNSRGLGLSDMVEAIEKQTPCRASGSMARHVLEVMLKMKTADDQKRVVPIEYTINRPEPLLPVNESIK